MTHNTKDSVSSTLRSTNKNQARLRLVWINPDFSDDPLMCAQSTFGQSSSQDTCPPDSRSTFTASASPQGRAPYATFRKCPEVVSHLSANEMRSLTDIESQNDLRSMPNYHHTVIKKQSPSVEFTKWLLRGENTGVKIQDLHEVRRENLRRFLVIKTWNKTDMAKAYAKLKKRRDPRPGFFSELLSTKEPKPGKKRRPFAEKLAWDIEDAVRLKRGQLSIKNSPLEIREDMVLAPLEKLKQALQDMSDQDANELLTTWHEIRAKGKGAKRRALPSNT